MNDEIYVWLFYLTVAFVTTFSVIMNTSLIDNIHVVSNQVTIDAN